MNKLPTSPKDDTSQAKKFADLARKLETDDDEARFDERLKKVAKAAPTPPKEPE